MMTVKLKALERDAWRAANLDLPDELAKLYDRADQLAADLATRRAGHTGTVNAIGEIVRGLPVDQAVKAEAHTRAVTEKYTHERKAISGAHRILIEHIGQWIASHRDELITTVLRPAVDATITEATALLPKVAKHAPTYDPDQLARFGTPTELAAWRTGCDLTARLAGYLTAFLSSWQTATGTEPGNHGVPGYLRIDAPGGLHVWENPDAVGDVNVRDGRNTDALAIATWAEAGGYRLAGGQEMLDLTQRIRTYRPWVVGEKQHRDVILPEPAAEPAAAGPGRRAPHGRDGRPPVTNSVTASSAVFTSPGSPFGPDPRLTA